MFHLTIKFLTFCFIVSSLNQINASNIFNIVNKDVTIQSTNMLNCSDVFSSVEDQILWKKYTKAQIIVLNKITAKSKIIDLVKNHNIFIGNLEITLKECRRNNDSYNPQSQVALNVIEHRIDDDKQIVFNGWLFSASPSISTLEHSVYEIFVKNCHD